MAWLFQVWCRLVLRFYCPLHVFGQEHLPDRPYILCSNHASHLDGVALMLASGRPFKDFAMVAAQDYFFGPRLQTAANLLFKLIPLERRATQRQLKTYIEACKKFLDAGGHGLIIFPEGTRTRTGEMQRFKRGPAVVSTSLGLPLVPAYIDGSYRSWRKNNWFMRPRHIKVHFGPPIEPIATSDAEAPFATYRRITEELESRVHKLRERAKHGTGTDPHEMVGLGGRADGV
ncbi:MAG TPA: lysophospholipid acyltransferase family protein [Gemmatimonadales bacterium]|nr:lysophospholipid acyltransferase family protein [Gemmatimonadales bacterium]